MKGLVLIATLSLGILSGDAPVFAKDSKSKTNAPITPFKIPTGTPRNVAELTAHFQEIDKNLQSLSARFEQTLTMPDAGLSQHVEGSLQYLKPNRLHLENTKPERQIVVADGAKLWIYRVGQDQVVETSLDDWKKSDPLINNLLDFSSYSKLLSEYEVSYDSSTLSVTLRPREKTDEPFVLRLKLSGPYLFPMETDLDAGQTRIRTFLLDVHFNPKIPESTFRFVPPAGAQIFEHFKPPLREQPTSP